MREKKGNQGTDLFHSSNTRLGEIAQAPAHSKAQVSNGTLAPGEYRASMRDTEFKLVNDGQGARSIQHFLGHNNIQHTVTYTKLSPVRFRNSWPD